MKKEETVLLAFAGPESAGAAPLLRHLANCHPRRFAIVRQPTTHHWVQWTQAPQSEFLEPMSGDEFGARLATGRILATDQARGGREGVSLDGVRAVLERRHCLTMLSRLGVMAYAATPDIAPRMRLIEVRMEEPALFKMVLMMDHRGKALEQALDRAREERPSRSPDARVVLSGPSQDLRPVVRDLIRQLRLP